MNLSVSLGADESCNAFEGVPKARHTFPKKAHLVIMPIERARIVDVAWRFNGVCFGDGLFLNVIEPVREDCVADTFEWRLTHMTKRRNCAAFALILGISGCSGESDPGFPSNDHQAGSGGLDSGSSDDHPGAGGAAPGSGGDTAAAGGAMAAAGGDMAAAGGDMAAAGGDMASAGGDTAGVGGSMGSSTAVGTQGVTRGELLFSDDFERTNPLEKGWTSGYANGIWTIDEGVLTGLGEAAHSATLVNRVPWQSGIFEFDVNHGGGGIFGFIANGDGHSFAALFGRGANNGSLIIQDTTNGPRTTVPWPSPSEGVWFHVTIIINSNTAEILLNGESVGILESPGIGSVDRTLFQIRNHQDLMTVSFDNFEYWEAIE